MAATHSTSTPDRCSWCGAFVAPGDGFRAAEHPGERTATFCRLEHVVPWEMQGAHWDPGAGDGGSRAAGNCAHCQAALSDVHVDLVRHRGAHRIRDAFCSAAHMAEWAKDGGRFG